MTCPANVIANCGFGQCNAVITFASATATDNCGTATVTQIAGPASGASFAVGSTTLTFRATDASGNARSCSLAVTVTDNENPNLTCPANVTMNTTPGLCTAIVSYTAPVGTDNCPGVTTALVSGLGSGATFPKGISTEAYRASDATGNVKNCTFTITVEDHQDPSLTCPANVAVSNDLNTCTATVSYAAPVGFDNCAGLTTMRTAGMASNASFPIGVTTETFLTTDASGNTSTCSFTISVADVEPPVLVCGNAITANASLGNCSSVITFAAASLTDNCPGATSMQSAGLASGSVFPVGSTIISYIAADAAGNTSSCAFTVQVVDAQVPNWANCPANLGVLCHHGDAVCDICIPWFCLPLSVQTPQLMGFSVTP